MEILLSEKAGFCFGVERAVRMTEEILEKSSSVYTWGPIVHNEHVISELEDKGVHTFDPEGDIATIPAGSSVVIRAHGITKKKQEELETSGLQVIDATCPFVKKIHRIVSEQSSKGDYIVVTGDPDHPEVKGIAGWCEGDILVTEDPGDPRLQMLPKERQITVAAQTTFQENKFKKTVAKLEEGDYNLNIASTICSATRERQEEASRIAERADLMLVFGSPNSSNSRKLYSICEEHCSHTYFIQSAQDLKHEWFQNVKCVGITAGASTPKKILKEVKIMAENFDELLDESLKTIHNGEVVKGTVIAVKDNEIIVNIGYKADGIIQKSEFNCEPGADLNDVVKVGDEVEAKIIKTNDGDGQVALSTKRVRTERVSQMLQDAFDNKTPLTAVVDEVVKGGLSLTVDEVKVFIPASLVNDVFERDLSKYAGQEITFMLTEYNPRRHRVIGDRKQLVAAEKEKALNELLSSIQIGDVIEGTVKNVTNFGAFIDLGGADGLLHISETSWGRTENPKKAFHVGDKVKTFIKSIDGTKIALSRKFPGEDPWVDAENKYAVGTVVTGKVARLTDFGAFVEIAKGVDGLLHVSQIQRERVDKPSDVLTVGQEITAKITAFDPEAKKISLSMKALLPKPERRNRPERNNRRQEENVDEADFDIEAYIRRTAAEADEEKPAEE